MNSGRGAQVRGPHTAPPVCPRAQATLRGDRAGSAVTAGWPPAGSAPISYGQTVPKRSVGPRTGTVHHRRDPGAFMAAATPNICPIRTNSAERCRIGAPRSGGVLVEGRCPTGYSVIAVPGRLEVRLELRYRQLHGVRGRDEGPCGGIRQPHRHSGRACRTGSPIMSIQTSRGRGVARLAIEAVEDEARPRGIDQLWADAVRVGGPSIPASGLRC